MVAPAGRKRLRPTWDIKTHQYWVRIPDSVLPAVIQEAVRMATYWNQLCDRLTQAWDDEIRLLGDEYQRLCRRAEILQVQLQDIVSRRSQRDDDGARLDSESDARVLALVREHRETWREATALRRARRTDVTVAPQIKALWDSYQHDIARLGTSSGCHQTNRTSVADSFQLAVRRLTDGAGRPKKKYVGPANAVDPAAVNRITLRHRFGSGGLPVPRCSANRGVLFHLGAISHDAYASNARAARRRRRTIGHLRLQLGGRGSQSYLEIPFMAVLHRPLPDDGVIKVVQLIGRRSFGVWSWRLSITLEQPPATAVAEPDRRHRAGLDLNWRHITPAGGPSAIRFGAVVDSAGEESFLSLPLVGQCTTPPHRRRRFTDHAHLSELHRRSGDLLETTKARLKGLLGDEGALPEPVAAWAANLAQMGRRGLLKGLSLLETAGVAPEAQALLRSRWLPEDRRIRQRTMRLSHHLTNRRTHLYRNLALALCRRYRVIAIKGDFAVSRVSRRAPREVDERDASGLDAEAALMQSGRYRQWAAIDSFVRYLEEAGRKTRTVIFRATGAFVTVTHSRCGTVVPRGRAIELHCPTCGIEFDQDINAARNLLLQIPSSL